MVRRRLMLALAVFVAVVTVVSAQPKTTMPDISGTWAVVVTFPGPPGMPDGGFRATVTFKQRAMLPDGAGKPQPLDGYYAHQNGNSGPFMGIVNDKKVMFTTIVKSSEHPGVTHFTDFTGTYDGEKTIKGHVINVSTGPGTYMRGEGPFVATRKPSSARR
jgi:hypothetical protein